MAISKASKANKIKQRRKKKSKAKKANEPKTVCAGTVTQPGLKTILKAAIAKLEADQDFGLVGVDYEYDSNYPCQKGDYYGDESACDPYCRCKEISNAQVIEVDINQVVNVLCRREPKDNSDLIDKYCLDRVLRQYKLYDPNSWEVNSVRGYYGDEIGSVTVFPLIRKNIITMLHSVANFRTNSEKIKKVLEYEYGFVLPALVPLSEAYIDTVDINDLVFGNKEYARKIKKPDIDIYDSYELPRAICTTEAGKEFGESKYYVRDGYHRVLSAKNKGDKYIKIIILDY